MPQVRRWGWLGLLVLAALWWFWPRAAPIAEGSPEEVVRAVRLRRGARPQRVTVPPVVAEPVEAAEAAGGAAPAPARMTLEDLRPEARQALGEVAMRHLRALADGCVAEVEVPQSVGAFVTVDAGGVLEMELRAIDPDADQVEVVDAELPDALVDCLDDALWDQDWSAAGAAVPAGSELPLALTMHLGPE